MPARKKVKTHTDASTGVARTSKDRGKLTTRRKAVRGRRGGLRDMPDMPLDVLLEIFGFMHPRDLLALARTDKAFRAFLMTRNAQTLWSAALESVEGLPRCPSYMSEPAYVNLLFCNHCHNCLKNNVRVVLFQYAARYCPACRELMFTDESEYLVFFRTVGSVTSTGPLPTYIHLIAEAGHMVVHKPQLAEFQTRWEQLDDVAAKKGLILQFEAKKNLILEASNEYYSWECHQKAKRSDELDEIRAARVQAIRDHLREMGWEKEISYMATHQYLGFDFERQKFATRSEALTNRVWHKIQGDVIAFVNGVRTQRIAEERKILLHTRFTVLAKAVSRHQGPDAKRDRSSDFEPHLKDFMFMPEFHELLDAPSSAGLSILDDPRQLRDMFGAGIAAWKKARKDELSALVAPSLLEDDSDPLALALTVFRCKGCRRCALRYPEVLVHHCQRRFYWRYIPSWRTGNVGDVYRHAVATYGHFYRSHWEINQHLTASTEAISFLRPILEACGLNPDTATRREADECGARLICRQCEDVTLDFDVTINMDDSVDGAEESSYCVFDWSGALNHCIQGMRWAVLDITMEHEWERVSEDEAVVIYRLEDELRSRDDHSDRNLFLHNCSYCEYIGSRDIMPQHLKKRHDREVTIAEVDDHCYIGSDKEPKLPTIVLERHNADGTFQVNCRKDSNELADVMILPGLEILTSPDESQSDTDEED
ncbi:hypothetical protein BD309DRAFT_985349 [Dichomitus squalens]|uniref:Uncharacterized protein n=1 Tax=Dichomitus squalens TaxID=114155 RepID=A0A4Q9QDN5_9APHY|nr:hypothetical protein BD309DRAFT_985349 [Dichomitus squalens]TBU65897.1 hypothetical protein BD310DRAFT_971944 [Dichomitus squalens]